MSKFITLFHGSETIVEVPLYKGGSDKNDFGNGFYCTCSLNVSKEWGTQKDGTGFANEYELDIENLKIFDLTNCDCLVWVSVLLKNRNVGISSPLMQMNVEFMIEKYYPKEIEEADIVIGYRADDSYFSWAKDFLNNKIDIEQLEEAICLNDLGVQIFLQSKKSFQQIRYVGTHKVEHFGYYNRKVGREREANRKYMDILSKNFRYDGIYISDLRKIESVEKTNKHHKNLDGR